MPEIKKIQNSNSIFFLINFAAAFKIKIKWVLFLQSNNFYSQNIATIVAIVVVVVVLSFKYSTKIFKEWKTATVKKKQPLTDCLHGKKPKKNQKKKKCVKRKCRCCFCICIDL